MVHYQERIHGAIKEHVLDMLPDLPDIWYVVVDNQFYIPDEYSGPA
jgi:hypothetical protein